MVFVITEVTVTWVGLFRLGPDFRIQISFRK